MSWRKCLITKGKARNAVIIAVWLKDSPRVYGIYEVVRSLNYFENSEDRRRQRKHHEEEILVYRGIFAEEYWIIACFFSSFFCGGEAPMLLGEEVSLCQSPWPAYHSKP